MDALYEVLTALDLDEAGESAADLGWPHAPSTDDVLADHEPLFYARGWEWSIGADGGLRGDVRVPRAHLSWLAARLRQELTRRRLEDRTVSATV